jgi:ribonuclease HI
MTPVAVVHLDESCLGNGREGDNPGGGGGLVEARTRGGRIERRDVFVHSPATTNNRMALTGALVTLELLGRKQVRLRVLIVSDSEYLVRGMREWVSGWRARGWKRKGGPIENLELWQSLADASRLHDVQWTWVRGHRGHAKNEYANDLAIKAAREQTTSAGLVPSEFEAWLERKRSKGKFLAYDPDATFAALEARVASDEPFPHADARA